MAKHMTEAAQLYWGDFDVLEEARNELADYFSGVKTALTSRLCQIWIEDEGNHDVQSEEQAEAFFKKRSYQQHGLAGMMSLEAVDKDSTFWVVITSPQDDGDKHNFTVDISISKQNRRRLEKAPEQKEQLTAIAAEDDIKLSWHNGPLYIQTVPFDPTDDADSIGRALAEVANEQLHVAAKMEAALAATNKLENSL